MAEADMFTLLRIKVVIHHHKMREFGSILSEKAGVNDFYSSAMVNLVFYTLYIAKADGEADEDEISDILETFSAITGLPEVIKGIQESFMEYEFDVIKKLLWDKTLDFLKYIAILVYRDDATTNDVKDIISFYNDFADVIIASDGTVDDGEKIAKEEYEDYFIEIYNYYTDTLNA